MEGCSNQRRCIFSGSAHPELAAEIAAYLGTELSPCRIVRFSNDNLYVQLLESAREREVFIVQPLVHPVHEHLMELLLLLDAARSTSARRVNAVVPYYSYARSDKKDEPRISIAARLVADLMVTAGAQHVMTMTLHSPQVHGFFSVPMDHLSSLATLVQHFQQKDLSDTCVVTPDIGNAKRAIKFARALGLPMIAGNKERVADDRVEMHGLIGDVHYSRAIIYDDEIANAGTMVAAIGLLQEKGVRQFHLACTHGLFTGQAIARLQAIAGIEEIVMTNTVPLAPEKRLPNMTVLSVAPVFGEAIRRNMAGESVAPLFAY
ncbi:MAG: ribose-phosphate diphosphokinase [Anaerolineae bacterium]